MLVNKVLNFPIILKVNHSPQTYCFEVRACGSKGLMAVLPPWGLTFHFLAKPGETGINKRGVFKAEELLCQSHFESFNYFLLSKREGRSCQQCCQSCVTHPGHLSSEVIPCTRCCCCGKFQGAIVAHPARLQPFQQDLLQHVILGLLSIS